MRKTGIGALGEVPWGTHICQFYQTKDDLLEILVPYFKTGLENNEFCMLVTSEPLGPKEARLALQKEITGLDDYLSKGQMEILDARQWYTSTGGFEAERVLEAWAVKEKQALAMGFTGLRVAGNISWLKEEDWGGFF